MIEEEKHPDPGDGIFNHAIWDVSVVPMETTLTISDSTETDLPFETESSQ